MRRVEWLLEEFKPQELAFDPSSAGICNGIRLVSSELEIFLSFLYIRYCGRDCGADIRFPAPSSCQADAGGRIPYTPAKRCDSTRVLRISCCRKAHGTCKKGHHCEDWSMDPLLSRPVFSKLISRNHFLLHLEVFLFLR